MAYEIPGKTIRLTNHAVHNEDLVYSNPIIMTLDNIYKYWFIPFPTVINQEIEIFQPISADGDNLEGLYQSSSTNLPPDTACFKLEKWEEFAEIIKNSSAVKDFDYFNYKPKNKKISICGVCQKNKKTPRSLSCNDCHREKGKVAIKPTKEELENLVKEMPMTKIGEKYGVSDNAVKKWCKKYNIVLENRRGYWTKIKKTKLI